MKTTSQNHGKISEHFSGLGTVSSETVVARARELALINGRMPNQYTQEDFDEAKKELTGAVPETDDESEEEPVPGLVAWDEPPNQAGGPVPKTELEDETSAAELLTEEGIVEAEHDQMVQGAKNDRNQS